jgi:hypothetical protein
MKRLTDILIKVAEVTVVLGLGLLVLAMGSLFAYYLLVKLIFKI